MKKAYVFLLLLACLLLPIQAEGKEPLGLYAAPKFLYGFTSLNLDLHASAPNKKPTIYKSKPSEDLTGGALSAGFDFGVHDPDFPIRAELEFGFFKKYTEKTTWEQQLYSKTNLEFQTLLFNLYFDIENNTEFTPYLSTGVGTSIIKFDTMYETVHLKRPLRWKPQSATTYNVSWHIGAGISYRISDTLSLDLGYRFLNLGKAETTSSFTPDNTNTSVYLQAKDIRMHVLMLGGRITF